MSLFLFILVLLWLFVIFTYEIVSGVTIADAVLCAPNQTNMATLMPLVAHCPAPLFFGAGAGGLPGISVPLP
jgi:hypothetical protein